MKIKLIPLLLISIGIIGVSGCKKKYEKIEFNDIEFYSKLDMDKYYLFIFCLSNPELNSCLNKNNLFENLNIQESTIYNGDTLKFNSLYDLKPDLYDYDSLSKLVALSYYLKHNNLVTERLYDQLLSLSIIADTTLVVANYELAKHRFQTGNEGLAMFLIDRLSSYVPDNKEIQRLKREIHFHYKEFEFDSTLSYSNYFTYTPFFK